MTVPMVHIFRFVACAILVALTLVAAQDCKTLQNKCKLQPGVSVRLTIPRNQKRYYYFDVTQAEKDNAAYKEISVVLTKLSGQAEAYVTKGGQARATWSTVSSGSEVINCLKTCETGFGCPKLGTGNHIVMVQSAASTDSITRLVYSWNTQPIQLALEDPQIDDVEYHAHEYFKFIPSSAGPSYTSITALNIIKTAISGTSYVTITYNVDDGAPAECTQPTRSTPVNNGHCKVKHSYSSDASILIGDGTSTQLDPTKPMYIGVYGASSPQSMYTILVTQDNGNITLVDGMPQVGQVSKNARHFYRLETEGTSSACLPPSLFILTTRIT